MHRLPNATDCHTVSNTRSEQSCFLQRIPGAPSTVAVRLVACPTVERLSCACMRAKHEIAQCLSKALRRPKERENLTGVGRGQGETKGLLGCKTESRILKL